MARAPDIKQAKTPAGYAYEYILGDDYWQACCAVCGDSVYDVDAPIAAVRPEIWKAVDSHYAAVHSEEMKGGTGKR